MSEATSTVLGEIKMTGKLAGTGTNPQLATISGLTAGQYGPIVNISVTSDGLVSSISNSTLDVLSLIPSATTTSRGLVSLGANIYTNGANTSGYQDVNFSGTLVGTNASGIPTVSCSNYSSTLSIVIIADNVTKNLILNAANCTTVNNFITELNSHLTGAVASLVLGNIRITSSTTGTTSSVSITSGFSCLTGFVGYSTAIAGVGVCQIYVPNATDLVAGVVKVGAGITLTGNTISVTGVNYSPATTTTLGSVIVPTSGNITIDVSGNISIPSATTTVKGVLSVPTANGLSVTAGVLAQALATSTTNGVVSVPTANGLSISAGVLSYTPTVATSAVQGILSVPTANGLSISAGVLSYTPVIATTTVLGSIKVGTNLTIDGTGLLAGPNGATTATPGLVYLSGNLTSDGTGVISIGQATSTVKGILSVPTANGLSVTSGVLSFNVANVVLATTSTKGIVSVPTANGLSVTAGVVSFDPTQLPVATTSTKGIVSVPSTPSLPYRLVLSAGTLSLALDNATSTTKGIAKVGVGLVATAGSISVDTTMFIRSDTPVTFQAAFGSVAGSFSNGSQGNNIDITIPNNTGSAPYSIPNITSPVIGAEYIFKIIVGSTGNNGITFSWGSHYKFSGGTSLQPPGTGGFTGLVKVLYFDATTAYCSVW